MHSFLSPYLPAALCLSALYIPAASATPLNKLQKRFDLDGNGVPDLCGNVNAQGDIECMLPDGVWTSIATSTYYAGMLNTKPTPTSAKVAVPAQATGSLPDPATFKTDNGTKWTIEYVGNLQFTGGSSTMSTLGGDKCRSSKLGSKVIWNCGDMECGSDYTKCGFSMGPAFYGTSDVMKVDVTGVNNVNDNTFLQPWSKDPPLGSRESWGMDTSNVAAINDTHGVAYAWEIQRGSSTVNEGNAVASITLGDTKPIATRIGPLLSGPNTIALGLLAILAADDYIYIYSTGGPSKLIVGRVPANDDVFDASKYSFLEADGTTWSTPTGGIPETSSTTYAMKTANSSGQFGCDVYGSVFYSAYLQKYVMICTAYEWFVNMYVSATPEGPWSEEYGLLQGWGPGYGSHAHPEFSTDGQQSFYFSQGPDGPFNMFKVSFNF